MVALSVRVGPLITSARYESSSCVERLSSVRGVRSLGVSANPWHLVNKPLLWVRGKYIKFSRYDQSDDS